MDKNLILGGVFATHTEMDADGNIVEKDHFHLRLYWELFHSGAIMKLKGAKLHVLLAIAMHADKRAESWPSIDRLTDLVPYGKNAINQAIQSLEEDGFIEREQGRGQAGQFGSMKYRIRYGVPDEVKDEIPEDGDETPDESTVSQKGGHGENPQENNVSTVSHFSGYRKVGYKKEKDDIKDDIKTTDKDDKRAREKKESISLKDLDISFLPDDYPKELKRIVEKRTGLFPTLEEAMVIHERAIWAHGKAARLLGYEIPNDFPLAAKVLRDVIRIAAMKRKKGKEIKDLPAYFHNALADQLFNKHIKEEKEAADKENGDGFVPYNWVRDEGER